ncbi:MAG: MFS transporter [Ruminococcus flavefaciens]|nr:MFS transporter [Ruminococcus flavefaciens]
MLKFIMKHGRTFFIGLAFLSISAFWQMYDNVVPLMLQRTFNLGETITGALMAMDNVLALVLLPVFGSLSDRVDTRLGKRMPFILTGTILAVCFMTLLPYADRTENLVLFVAALFFTLLSMGLYRSPAVALMPDLTPNYRRSRANAVINLMGAVGGVYALIMIRFLVGKGYRPDYSPLFISVAALMVVAVGVLLLTIRENRLRREAEREEKLMEEAGETPEAVEEAGGLRESSAASKGMSVTVEALQAAADKDGFGEKESVGAINSGEKPSADTVPEGKKETNSGQALPSAVKRSMIFLLLSIFFWFTAYNAVTTAFSRYTQKVWGMEGGSYADCLMVATVAAILSYIPIGGISSRIGRKKTILGGILIMAACYLAAVFVGAYHPLINIAFAMIGVGWAAINVNSYPMIVAMSQGGDIGKYTGTYYTFSMAAQIFTPIFSGFLLENVSYRTLFPYALIFALASFCTMSQVRHGDVKPPKKKSLLENFDVDD